MVLVMVNEAARVLEEGVVEAPEDVDFGMIMGTGWAPFRGGPLRYADNRGLAEIVRRWTKSPHSREAFRAGSAPARTRRREWDFYGPRAAAAPDGTQPQPAEPALSGV